MKKDKNSTQQKDVEKIKNKVEATVSKQAKEKNKVEPTVGKQAKEKNKVEPTVGKQKKVKLEDNVANNQPKEKAVKTKKNKTVEVVPPSLFSLEQENEQDVVKDTKAKDNANKLKKESKIKKPRILSKEEVGIKPKTKKKKKKKTSIEDAVRINSDPKIGLSKLQVEKQIEEKLVNRQENKNVKTYKRIFFSNIFTFFNLLCFTVCGALIAVKAYSNLMFMLIILCNIAIGIVQEIRAKLTIEKISLVSAPTATVIRDGIKQDIAVADVVLDDIIFFNLGKQICADSIVVEGEVEVNESLLTGESVAIKKKKGDLLYSGSFIASGKCVARVEKIGEYNYSASLAAKAKEYKKPKSELLHSLSVIIRAIGIVIIPLAVLMFYNNFGELGNDLPETIKKTAGSIIGMIPAGMFLLTSMALAVGVVKLARKRTLVQDLYSIEMLARADVLCLDKTGTITDGTMKVNTVVQIKKNMKNTIGDVMGSLLTALDDNNQTSRALATHFGYSKEFTAQTILPFSSARKLSAVTFKNGETYVIGAPEFVMKTKDEDLEKLIKQYTTKGFRVLLLAQCDGEIVNDKVPLQKTPVAVMVIEDHIREDAPETIKWFRENAVQIKIISGDNPQTVSEVSKRVGVDKAEKFISLEGLSEQQVIEAAENYTVFGRVSPEQKSILVKALKNKGHKVAMTGDGVNDILALKEADCSIAMASGSEATRNVSHLVLLDSNFASMPSVVAEGRRVVNNIQKSSSLYLMKTLFTMLISIFCLIVSTNYPFNTNQMMLLEYCVIGVPSFFLALQPNKDPIKGRFLPNLITKALPGAIIFTLNVIACWVFDKVIGTNGQFETMASLILTFAGLLVLFKLCKPFDVFRGVLYTSMLLLCVAMLAFIPFSFFEYVDLSLQNILFIIVLVQFSYPLYANVVNLCNKIRFPNM